MISRPTRVIRSSELRAARGKQRASQRGELNDLRARLVKTETQAFRNLRGDASALESLAAIETILSEWAPRVNFGEGVSVADDQVGVLHTLSEGNTGLMVVAARTATIRLSVFGIGFVSGTPGIDTIYLGTDSELGGIGVPAAGAGTDGTAGYYISAAGVVRVSNRLGAEVVFDSLFTSGASV